MTVCKTKQDFLNSLKGVLTLEDEHFSEAELSRVVTKISSIGRKFGFDAEDFSSDVVNSTITFNKYDVVRIKSGSAKSHYGLVVKSDNQITYVMPITTDSTWPNEYKIEKSRLLVGYFLLSINAYKTASHDLVFCTIYDNIEEAEVAIQTCIQTLTNIFNTIQNETT